MDGESSFVCDLQIIKVDIPYFNDYTKNSLKKKEMCGCLIILANQ